MATLQWRLNNQEKLKKYRRKYYQNNKVTEILRIKKRMEGIKTWISNCKKEKSCSCGESHPACLDFHHKNPKEKDVGISQIARLRGWGLPRIKKEIAKCEILCSNCHRKLHFNDNTLGR